MSSSASATATAAAATSSAATKTLSAGSNLKIVGIILAIASGVLIGSSFVFKKKGLLRAQAGHAAGEGVAYLKSPLWWLGMSMMILGEICNFAAYAFVEAVVVTPLGALSVVICAILSSMFLNEKLSFFGWLGCGLCIIGSVIIALNGPQEASVGQIREFQKLFLAPGFLVYTSVLIATSLVIIFYFAPKYGKKSMLWYISVCSMIGGISVSVTTGLGAAIVQTALGDNQFKYWFMYFLMAFVVVTLLTEVYYLNVALALFNTAMVTPTYYVIFTFFSLVTTVVLFQGLKASASQIITIVMAFLVICVGITILQMSKVDPVQLSKLDRKSTILLQAARSKTETVEEKGAVGMEDPGMDALRGSFGTFGSIIRAKSARRMSQSARGTGFRARPSGAAAPYDPEGLHSWASNNRMTQSPTAGTSPLDDALSGMKRHQLYDAPVPMLRDDSSAKSPSLRDHRPTIKFGSQDMVHQYHPTGTGDHTAIHEARNAQRSPQTDGYPPTPTPNHPQLGSQSPRRGQSPVLSPSSANDSETGSLSSATALFGGSTRQTLSFPSHLSSEHQVQSAPPTTIGARGADGGFARLLPGRIESRDAFDKTPTGTLLSFPSVTDSTGSGGWDEDDPEQVREREREQDVHGRERVRSSGKRYPKGAGDDDREESESLWHGGEDDDSPVEGGIRLVKPSSGTRF